MSATAVPSDDRAREPRVGLVAGIGVPLAIVTLAYALWWIGDRLPAVGPLDRAAFGWLVVFPIWIAAPIAAALLWGRLTPQRAALAAVVVGSTISAVAAALFWTAVAFPNCAHGATRTPVDWIVPSILLGLTIGAGLAISGPAASRSARFGHPWRAVMIGSTAEVATILAAILAFASMVAGPGCQRPPV